MSKLASGFLFKENNYQFINKAWYTWKKCLLIPLKFSSVSPTSNVAKCHWFAMFYGLFERYPLVEHWSRCLLKLKRILLGSWFWQSKNWQLFSMCQPLIVPPPTLRLLKAWFGPNLHKIYPNVITLRKFGQKLSNFATLENPMTLTQFWLQGVSISWVTWPVKA